MDRLDCEFDTETIQAGGVMSSNNAIPSFASSPGSIGGGDFSPAYRMDRFEFRFVIYLDII